MNISNKRVEELREETGKVTFSDPLTTFIYLLLRDEVPCGKVERIIQEVLDDGIQQAVFTNGWLAKYANNLAELIHSAEKLHLTKSLERVFESEEIKRKQEADKPTIDIGGVRIKTAKVPSEEIEDSIMGDLQQKLDDTRDLEAESTTEYAFAGCNKEDADEVSKLINKNKEEITGKVAEDLVNHLRQESEVKQEIQEEVEDADFEIEIDNARKDIEQLKSKGYITEEDASRINKDFDEAKEEKIHDLSNIVIEVKCKDEETQVLEDKEIEEALKDLMPFEEENK